MPIIRPLSRKLTSYAKRKNLTRKLAKQIKLFEEDPNHPSLRTELLEPKSRRLYSFRIDKKYRAIFVYFNGDVFIIDINPHYE
jgi:plasmid maintenance system killer protein